MDNQFWIVNKYWYHMSYDMIWLYIIIIILFISVYESCPMVVTWWTYKNSGPFSLTATGSPDFSGAALWSLHKSMKQSWRELRPGNGLNKWKVVANSFGGFCDVRNKKNNFQGPVAGICIMCFFWKKQDWKAFAGWDSISKGGGQVQTLHALQSLRPGKSTWTLFGFVWYENLWKSDVL